MIDGSGSKIWLASRSVERMEEEERKLGEDATFSLASRDTGQVSSERGR